MEKAQEKKWYVVNITNPTDENHGATFLLCDTSVQAAVNRLDVLKDPAVMTAVITVLSERDNPLEVLHSDDMQIIRVREEKNDGVVSD